MSNNREHRPFSFKQEDQLRHLANDFFEHNTILFKKLDKNAKAPAKSGPDEACYDFFCVRDDDFSSDSAYILESGKSHVFHTGISLKLPKNKAMFLWDRSGMAAKRQLHRLAGVIDESYTGEILVCLINLGQTPQTISEGDKIIQGKVSYIFDTEMKEVDELPETYRGAKGFGSTGK